MKLKMAKEKVMECTRQFAIKQGRDEINGLCKLHLGKGLGSKYLPLVEAEAGRQQVPFDA